MAAVPRDANAILDSNHSPRDDRIGTRRNLAMSAPSTRFLRARLAGGCPDRRVNPALGRDLSSRVRRMVARPSPVSNAPNANVEPYCFAIPWPPDEAYGGAL
jgi:hypothetical protein